MEIRQDAPSGRWFISYFYDEHNHPLLDPRLTGSLRGHRFMFKADIGHMVNMKKGGIGVGQIYWALANQAGGYEYLFFMQRDMYNKIAKQRHQIPGDAYAALKYLEDQATNDPSLYFNHHMDDDGTLRNLFWCDGLSRADYSLFGDVLAFDATYKRNKYVSIGDTYRWLLQQLKVVMNGKAPVSVITDGDLSMKFAIQKEFPNAHHRLCAWHLIRNAISNIGKPQFTSMFKKCMPGDYEIDVFRQKWFEMVEKFGVENKNWVLDMYKKRHSWATAHIRGKFFAGFQTTSQCKRLNSIIAKYVNSRQLANFACQDNERFIFTREMAMNLLKQFKEEDAAQKELVNDTDSVRDDVQYGMKGHNRTTYRVRRGISQLEGRENDTFDNDLDDHMNIEDDSLVSI
ncbi:protein FAR1-RELATED SEQUENCE 5-like [Arachis hypogaea]|uniref:protein FAR1-RELATED SEQUENCE 5-like n=1 Tax=Arachis hypogaea TaxID=3818 RepID=UPI000787F5AB|nr:protein FAR1-RELATED SEQUENCE 5-like [Arachis hypogaea]